MEVDFRGVRDNLGRNFARFPVDKEGQIIRTNEETYRQNIGQVLINSITSSFNSLFNDSRADKLTPGRKFCVVTSTNVFFRAKRPKNRKATSRSFLFSYALSS